MNDVFVFLPGELLSHPSLSLTGARRVISLAMIEGPG
jgi:hypothetical protein